MARKKVLKKKAKKKTTTKKTRVSKRKVGRPSQFTEETRQLIYESLHKTPFRAEAAANARLSRRTIDGWYAKGQTDAEDGLETDFAEFFHKVNELIGLAISDCFGVIKRQAEKDWIAARYILQCINGKRYGTKAAIKLEDDNTKDGSFDGENIHGKLAALVAAHEGDN